MTTDLDQVVAGLRAGGWRSSEERLHATALKRLTTARRHQQQAAELYVHAQRCDDGSGRLHRLYLESALRHDVRGAERAGRLSRAVRNIALKLVPDWTGSAEELLAVAGAVAQTCETTAPHAHAALLSAHGEAPAARQAQAS